MNFFDYLFENSKSLAKDFILGPKESKTYEQIYQSSLSVANFLINEKGQDQPIAILSTNSSFFIATYLGIIKSGNICIPLNYALEKKNLEYILQSTGCSLIFTNENFKKNYEFPENCNVITEEIFEEICYDTSLNSEFQVAFDSSRIAEIIFTSGSTGKPKGVMLSHNNLMANTEAIILYLHLNSDDIIEIVLPFYYCYGLSLLHTHLRVGGSIVLNNTFMFLGSVINDLNTYRCTGFAGVPSHFQVLIKKTNTFKSSKFPHLKYVTQAGGHLPYPVIEEFTSTFPNVKFFVMYGQTEATARISYLEPDMIRMKKGSIGKAIPNVQLKVVDKSGNMLGAEEEGELVIKGDNVMEGYFGDNEGTKNAIRNGWLFTGDLAKMDDDGFFYITGRRKEILKVAGNRISPKEIEDVVLELPEIVHCKITSESDSLLGEALVATIAYSDASNQNTLKTKIIKHCAGKLASYKVPQKFVFLDNFRLSPSGKKLI